MRGCQVSKCENIFNESVCDNPYIGTHAHKLRYYEADADTNWSDKQTTNYATRRKLLFIIFIAPFQCLIFHRCFFARDRIEMREINNKWTLDWAQHTLQTENNSNETWEDLWEFRQHVLCWGQTFVGRVSQNRFGIFETNSEIMMKPSSIINKC